MTRQAIEAKLNKDYAATETLQLLMAYNDECAEWYGVCRRCGTKAHGTLTQLRKPCKVCDEGQAHG